MTEDNSFDWCPICTATGGYCGDFCNGAYNWYLYAETKPTDDKQTESK